MPIQRCKKNGVLGWRWGKSGHCYLGSGAKAKAQRQMRAIYSSGYTGNVEELDGRFECVITAENYEFSAGIAKSSQGIRITSKGIEGNSGQGLDTHEHTSSTEGPSSNAASSGSKNRRNGSAAKARAKNPLRIDPTRSATLRRQFFNEYKKRIALLKQDIKKFIVEDDAFGLRRSKPFSINARFSFMDIPQKIEEFTKWLDARASYRLLGDENNPWWNKFVSMVYRKGAERVFDDVNASRRASSFTSNESYVGRKLQFLFGLLGKSKSIQKMKILSSRMFSGLKGVKDYFVQRSTKSVTDGLEQGKTSVQIAKDIIDSVDSVSKSANRLIQTEITRMYAEGQLESLEELGIEEITIMAEWRTAGDDFVCSFCSSMEGVILTVEEASGMIPAHDLCRCAYLPVVTRRG